MALKVPASIVRHPFFIPIVGVLLSLAALWTFGRPRPEIDRARQHFVDLQRQRENAQRTADARSEFRRLASAVQTQSQAASQERQGTLSAALADLWARYVWADANGLRRAVLASPLITMPGRTPVAGTVAVYSARKPGCASCHLAVATPGFEAFPEPFRTHVQLSSYVGADSPHPPSRMGCAVCHQGNEDGEGFSAAGHSTLRVRMRPGELARAASDGGDGTRVVADTGQWTELNAQGAMLPVGRVSAGCVRCHAGERFQPGAVTRNEALTSMDRGGCYSCHDVPGLEGLPKRGPDLRRIGGKLSPPWVRRWIADPPAVKPATWMPRFWRADVLQSNERAELDAVVAYLFANAENYSPAVSNPPRGDAASGRQLVASVGCLGCHVVGPADRDATSLTRTFGPPLQGIGSKTTYAWLYDWVRDPQRFSPGSRMPRLRLSEREAADIATYLASLTNEALDPGPSEQTDPSVFGDVVKRYVSLGATAQHDLDATNVQTAKLAAGRAIIEVRGCFTCHEIRGFEGKRTTAPMTDVGGDTQHLFRRPLSVAPTGFVGPGPGANDAPNGSNAVTGPAFLFGSAEWDRMTLGSAVSAHRQPDDRRITVPWHLAKASGRALVHRFNCTGCHVVDGSGGDVASTLPPSSPRAPSLDTVGGRMTVGQLRAYLREPASTPGPSLRMPTFAMTDDEIAALSGYLQAIAPASSRPAASGAPVASTPALRGR